MTSSPANVRIAAGDSTCQLTYALSTDPAPVIASVPSSEASLALLTFVVTNDTGGEMDLASIRFSIPVGPDAASLSPSSADISGSPLDTRWQINGPSTKVSNGLAAFTLTPRSVSATTLPVPNGSAIVVLFKVKVNQLTGTSTIDIAEHIGRAPGFTGFGVTKYPPGFFFDGLMVNVPSGSGLQPVAQVVNGTKVTLSWNVSVVAPSAITIYQSSYQGPMQPVSPRSRNRWTTLGLVSDTVFTVVVTTTAAGGEPVTAAMTTMVAVVLPNALLNSLTVVGETESNGLKVTGTTSLAGTAVAGALDVTGATTMGMATMASASAATVTASGAATFNGAAYANAGLAVAEGLTADKVTATGTLTAGQLVSRNDISANLVQAGTVTARLFTSTSASTAMELQTSPPADSPTHICGVTNAGSGPAIVARSNSIYAAIECYNVVHDPDTSTGIYCQVAAQNDWGVGTNGWLHTFSGDLIFSHIPTRSGPRVITALAALEAEVQASGEGKLERGHATIVFDEHVADAIHHSKANAYRVQLTPTGRCGGLAVVAKSAQGFTVEELGGGKGNAGFDWFVVARRRYALRSRKPRDLPDRLPKVRLSKPASAGRARRK